MKGTFLHVSVTVKRTMEYSNKTGLEGNGTSKCVCVCLFFNSLLYYFLKKIRIVAPLIFITLMLFELIYGSAGLSGNE